MTGCSLRSSIWDETLRDNRIRPIGGGANTKKSLAMTLAVM